MNLPPTLDHLSYKILASGRIPKLGPVYVRISGLVNLPPTLDHCAGQIPGHAAQDGPWCPEQFINAIGGLLPNALCGRTSL